MEPVLPEINHHLSLGESIFPGISKKANRGRPINRGYYEPSRLCKVYQLDMTEPAIKNIPRAGVLFYTFIQGELHVCFGKDAKSGDLTDFGGGKRAGESPVKCAIREGNEESRYAFSNLKIDQIQGFYCLYSSNMLIIFIPVASPDTRDIRELTGTNFKEKQFLSKTQLKAKAFNEVSDIVWLDEAKLTNLFSERPTIQLFAKVRRFIYSCNDFSQNIEKMRRVLHSVIAGETEKYEHNELEQKVQQSFSTSVGAEIYSSFPSQSKLNQWLSFRESTTEPIPRRFMPEIRLVH